MDVEAFKGVNLILEPNMAFSQTRRLRVDGGKKETAEASRLFGGSSSLMSLPQPHCTPIWFRHSSIPQYFFQDTYAYLLYYLIIRFLLTLIIFFCELLLLFLYQLFPARFLWQLDVKVPYEGSELRLSGNMRFPAYSIEYTHAPSGSPSLGFDRLTLVRQYGKVISDIWVTSSLYNALLDRSIYS